MDFDFENAWKQWANEKPMDTETLMVQAAVNNQRANPDSKAFVYRDLLMARSFFKKTREKLDDEAFRGWFLHFDPKRKGRYHTADCDRNFVPPKCTTLYHDQTNTPQMNIPHNVTPFGPHAKGPPRGYPCLEPCDCGKLPCGEYHLRVISMQTRTLNCLSLPTILRSCPLNYDVEQVFMGSSKREPARVAD